LTGYFIFKFDAIKIQMFFNCLLSLCITLVRRSGEYPPVLVVLSRIRAR